uniref:Uncharacterized protein n=1 Tax=Mycena chlorophos TaxID=658473 RepID=A0ABQ0L5L5_MYCCL|nr:predicted protein [Mycena chlorophos]
MLCPSVSANSLARSSGGARCCIVFDPAAGQSGAASRLHPRTVLDMSSREPTITIYLNKHTFPTSSQHVGRTAWSSTSSATRRSGICSEDLVTAYGVQESVVRVAADDGYGHGSSAQPRILVPGQWATQRLHLPPASQSSASHTRAIAVTDIQHPTIPVRV